MGRWSSVVDAEPQERGNYMPWFNSKLRVRLVYCRHVTTNEGVEAFVVRFENKETLIEPDGTMDEEGNTFPKVGEERDWFCKLAIVKGGGNPGAADMQKFCAIAFPPVEELLDKIHAADSQKQKEKLGDELGEVFDLIVNEEENPLEDTELILTTVAIRTQRGKGNPFTRHEWKLVPTESAD